MKETNMAEEQVQQEVTQEVVEPTYSEVEVQAMSMGWKPKEQFEGDDSTWIDAKEFVGRKSLFDKIDAQSREIKDLRKTMIDFRSHYEKVRETEYKRAVSDLKAQRKEALKEEDVQTVLQIDDQLEELEQKKEDFVPQKTATQQVSPQFTTWVAENQWYQTDAEMARIADGIGFGYMQQYPGSSEEAVFSHVNKRMKEIFPEKFGGKKMVPTVDGGGNRQTTGKTSGVFKLPTEAEEMMNRFVKAGVMTREEYIKDYKTQHGE